jgi:hypothetical protein
MNTLEDALDINCVSRTVDERTRWFCLHVIISGDVERTTDRLNPMLERTHNATTDVSVMTFDKGLDLTITSCVFRS